MKRRGKLDLRPSSKGSGIFLEGALASHRAVSAEVNDKKGSLSEQNEQETSRTSAPGYLSFRKSRHDKYESPSDWIARIQNGLSSDIHPEYRCPASFVDMNPSLAMTRTGLQLMHFILATSAHSNNSTVKIKKSALSCFLSMKTPRVVEAVKGLEKCKIKINAASVKAGSKTEVISLMKDVNIGRYFITIALSDTAWAELRDPKLFAFVDLHSIKILKSIHSVALTPIASLLTNIQKDKHFRIQRYTELESGSYIRNYQLQIWPSDLAEWLGFDSTNDESKEPARLIRAVKAADKAAEKAFKGIEYRPTFSCKKISLTLYKRDMTGRDKVKLILAMRPLERNTAHERLDKKTFKKFNLSAPGDLYVSPKQFISLCDALDLNVGSNFLEGNMVIIQRAWKYWLVDEYKRGNDVDQTRGVQLFSEFSDFCVSFHIPAGNHDEMVAAEMMFEDLVFGRLPEVYNKDDVLDDPNLIEETPLSDTWPEEMAPENVNIEISSVSEPDDTLDDPDFYEEASSQELYWLENMSEDVSDDPDVAVETTSAEPYRLKTRSENVNIEFRSVLVRDVVDPETGDIKLHFFSMSEISKDGLSMSDYAMKFRSLSATELGIANHLQMQHESLLVS